MSASLAAEDPCPGPVPVPAQILPFRVPQNCRLSVCDEVDAPRPDGVDSLATLDQVAHLLADARSTLTLAQQQAATSELDALIRDAAVDAVREDPAIAVASLAGRTATAALRILIARALIRDEWDT